MWAVLVNNNKQIYFIHSIENTCFTIKANLFILRVQLGVIFNGYTIIKKNVLFGQPQIGDVCDFSLCLFMHYFFYCKCANIETPLDFLPYMQNMQCLNFAHG